MDIDIRLFKVIYNAERCPEDYKPCRIYIRISRYYPSINEQLEELQKYCNENKYFIKGTYIDKNTSFCENLEKRLALQLLIGFSHKTELNEYDLKPGEALIVLSFDRLFRNSQSLINLSKNNLIIDVLSNIQSTDDLFETSTILLEKRSKYD